MITFLTDNYINGLSHVTVSDLLCYLMYQLCFDMGTPITYSRTSIIRTSIIRNLDYPALQIVCFNDIHCNFGVHHLEYLLQVYIEL